MSSRMALTRLSCNAVTTIRRSRHIAFDAACGGLLQQDIAFVFGQAFDLVGRPWPTCARHGLPQDWRFEMSLYDNAQSHSRRGQPS